MGASRAVHKEENAEADDYTEYTRDPHKEHIEGPTDDAHPP